MPAPIPPVTHGKGHSEHRKISQGDRAASNGTEEHGQFMSQDSANRTKQEGLPQTLPPRTREPTVSPSPRARFLSPQDMQETFSFSPENRSSS